MIALANKGGDWVEWTFWKGVKEIVVEQLGVDPDEVTNDASFVDDLGARLTGPGGAGDGIGERSLIWRSPMRMRRKSPLLGMP